MKLNRRTVIRTTGLAVGAATVGVGAGSEAQPNPREQTIDHELSLDTDELQEVLVVFDENDQVDLLAQFDLADGYHKFEVLPIGFTRATGTQIAAIASLDPVRYVEDNKELDWHNDDAREATGAGRVQSEVGYTGETAHAAVIDSGIDADHPDHQRNLQHNYRYLNPLSADNGDATTWVDAEMVQQTGASGVTTDDNGHGTHVSGSVAGDGTASGGDYAGMAPDADLTVYSSGATLVILKAVAAFDHLIANHAPAVVGRDDDEAVYVVNNSYGVDSEALFNPSGSLETATKEAYENGILPVFSAGNAGPGINTLNDYSKAPYVLSVAATDDQGNVTGFSSRGLNPDSSAYSGDRKAALDNLAEYDKLEKGPTVTSKTKTASVGAGMDAGGIVDPAATYGESTYVEWTPESATGFVEISMTWTNNRQDIDIFLRKGGEDGPIVASSTNGQLTGGGGESLTSKRIEGGRRYTMELNPWASAQASVEITIDEFELDAGDSSFEAGDPIGLYRNGVGAPGSYVMSTMDPAAPLQVYPALGADSDPEGSAQLLADQADDPFYGHISGTSMAAPVVTGIVTLLVDAHKLENGEYPTPDELIRFIEGTADHLNDTYTPANIGTGFVNAEAAVRATGFPDGLPSWDDVNANVVDFGDEPEFLTVTGSREDGGDFFTAGQTMEINLTVGGGTDADPSHDVDVVYDVIPDEWEVDPVDGDDLQYEDGEPRTEPTEDGSATKVFIDGSVPAGGSATFTYFVEAPSGPQQTGSYAFGPAQADSDEVDDGAVAVSGTSDTNVVAGQSSEIN